MRSQSYPFYVISYLYLAYSVLSNRCFFFGIFFSCNLYVRINSFEYTEYISYTTGKWAETEKKITFLSILRWNWNLENLELENAERNGKCTVSDRNGAISMTREKARVSWKASQGGGPEKALRYCARRWIFNSRSEWRATKERERIPREQEYV